MIFIIFKRIFLNENVRIAIQISPKFVPKGLIYNKNSFSSGNGLAPKRRQAITWTNADPVHRCIYAALGGDELTVNGMRCVWPKLSHHHACRCSSTYWCQAISRHNADICSLTKAILNHPITDGQRKLVEKFSANFLLPSVIGLCCTNCVTVDQIASS